MIKESKKAVLRNFSDFLRRDVAAVVRDLANESYLQRQQIRREPAPANVNRPNVRPQPVKGRLLQFPSPKRAGY